MNNGKIRCKLEKVGDKGYRVLRFTGGKWKAWLENEQYDWVERGYRKEYYKTPAAAKSAARAAAAMGRKKAKESEEFEV